MRPPPQSPINAELGKVPFLVRGKVRRTTRKPLPKPRGIDLITADILYEAKAHYSH